MIQKWIKIGVVLFVFTNLSLSAQTLLTGQIKNAEDKELVGASIHLSVHASVGSVSDDKGYFELLVNEEEGTIKIDYLGYATKELPFNKTTDFKKIILIKSYEDLEKVVITGTTDLATDRYTPVATSTIGHKAMVKSIGNKSLPEILLQTPSVYATKSGGGMGDGRINIRGFDQQHIAILLNGIPMNDMENSGMYWSNFLGIENVTSAIQVQRGLGASKLAISSVGGTINFVTNSSKKKKSTVFTTAMGNDTYLNTQFSYNTGLLKNGFSTSINLGYQSGEGYIKGTAFKAYNYFMNFGWKNQAHEWQFSILGAPQNHGQRAKSYFNMATIATYLKHGVKYNYNHGYLNGKDYNWTENYYHKPIISLSWDWNIKPKSMLSTTLYTSFGRGGGTSDLGRLPGNNFASSSIFRDKNGLVRFDDIKAYNQGKPVLFSDGNTYQRESTTSGTYINSFFNKGLTRRAFTNSHTWLGTISNYKYKINENLTTNLGIDLRYSKGINYTRVNDLLGADAYYDSFNVNQPKNLVTQTYKTDLISVINVFKDTAKDEKIFFHAEGLVKWMGLFSNFSYTNTDISAFLQTAISNQSFKRIDYFNYLDTDTKQATDWIAIVGGTIKAGINYNLNKQHNLYLNTGYYTKQPGFNVVFLSFNNTINKKYKNEKVLGFELGYGYKTDKAAVKLNLYQTSWANRFTQVSYQNATTQGMAKIVDLQQLHKGLELESSYKYNKFLLTSMLSVGDWIYANNVTAAAYDSEQEYIGDVNLNLKGVKVQDAAQFTARLGLSYKASDGLELAVSQFYADNLYAAIAPDDNWANYDTPLKLPSYSLFDARLLYQIKLNHSFLHKMSFNLQVDNIFNTAYIAESATNYQASATSSKNWHGINKENKVFFGFGRTWHFSLRLTL